MMLRISKRGSTGLVTLAFSESMNERNSSSVITLSSEG